MWLVAEWIAACSIATFVFFLYSLAVAAGRADRAQERMGHGSKRS